MYVFDVARLCRQEWREVQEAYDSFYAFAYPCLLVAMLAQLARVASPQEMGKNEHTDFLAFSTALVRWDIRAGQAFTDFVHRMSCACTLLVS